tara:strand:+ start:257 stop:1906 length:1650 start_codon:yes stop_codon:yes gene_type:complete
VNDIPLPKPKKPQGIKRTKGLQDDLKKAKRATRIAIKKQETKVAKAQTKLVSARLSAESKKKSLKEISQALNGTETTLVDEGTLDNTPDNVQELVKNQEVIFQPNNGPQTSFLASSEREVFYGGARGGGKSYAMLVDPLRYCHKAQHRALLIRRSMPELRDMITHSQRLYSRAFKGAKWREQEKEWRFPSGARIEFGYAENMTDVLRYQGQSYTWIGVDELPQYPTPDVYNFLRSSLRSVDPDIPVYMRATGNPGNIGSQWVKETFVDPSQPGKAFNVSVETPNGVRKISRRFIPAKLQDNPYLMQTDDYYIMLASLPEVQRKQFLEGDWSAFENSSFPEFNPSKHIVQPFEIPKGWAKFRTCDWGYSSPACCLWIAIDWDNNLWVYRELYTKKITADDFAKKVIKAEIGENMRYGILDSSTWAKRGDVGPSIAETMIQEGCRWRPSDRSPKSRINGKLEIHKRLKLHEESKEPTLKIFSNCVNLIRTLPLLPLDKNNPEDVDTNAEDHAYDALRYGVMSRPMHPSATKELFEKSKVKSFQPIDRVFGY